MVAMAGATERKQTSELRSAVEKMFAELQESSEVSDSARDAFFQLVDVLESSTNVVVLPSNELMSTQQAADLLGVSRMTVVRLVDRGELAAEGGGVHRRISAEELARYQKSSAERRRSAISDFAAEIDENTPPDEIIRTR
jgi:excisionase family DNA binding protein